MFWRRCWMGCGAQKSSPIRMNVAPSAVESRNLTQAELVSCWQSTLLDLVIPDLYPLIYSYWKYFRATGTLSMQLCSDLV